jgi:hypothetical protein
MATVLFCCVRLRARVCVCVCKQAFHVTAEGSGLIPSLRRVLLAYSKRNPSVGYCQGMNFVCAMSEPNLARQPAIQPARWVLGQPCLSIKPLLRFDGLACLLACFLVCP